MKGTVKAQLGFGDQVLGARAAGNAVRERMNSLTPRSEITGHAGSRLQRHYRPTQPRPWAVKRVLLQHLYNLSDSQCEAQVRDRLSFMRFVCLGLANAVRDETALGWFRAGMRSYVADKSVVAGFDARALGFFWLAGQGGYGIQTAPAMGRIAAALVQGKKHPQISMHACGHLVRAARRSRRVEKLKRR